MEPFTVRIEIASLKDDNFTAIDAFVTYGVSHSGLPVSFLKSLHITPTETTRPSYR